MLLDLDGDGRDDLVVASPQERWPRRETRVSAGTRLRAVRHHAALPATLDLATMPDEVPHLWIDGADDGDLLAYSMALGDVNGDGLQRPRSSTPWAATASTICCRWPATAYVLDAVDDQPSPPGATVVPTRTPTDVAVADPDATVTPTATAPSTCAGDCNGNGDRLHRRAGQRRAHRARQRPGGPCAAADRDGNGAVSVGELIAAVNVSLGGCG